MEVAIHLPDDVAASVPWEDVPRHILEQIALEGYGEGWVSEEQVRRLLGHPPNWLTVQPAQHGLSAVAFPKLGAGEHEAIPLAQELPDAIGFPGASEKFCTLACPTPGSEGTPGSAMLCSLRRYVVSAARRPRTT